MRFHVELRTEDPELTEILREVRNKAKFVKKALKHYVCSKQGKETFRVMSKREIRDTGSVKKGTESQGPENRSPFVPEKKIKSTYDLDKFL